MRCHRMTFGTSDIIAGSSKIARWTRANAHDANFTQSFCLCICDVKYSETSVQRTWGITYTHVQRTFFKARTARNHECTQNQLATTYCNMTDYSAISIYNIDREGGLYGKYRPSKRPSRRRGLLRDLYFTYRPTSRW